MVALPFLSMQFTASLNCVKKGTGQLAKLQNIKIEREKVKTFKIHYPVLRISGILISSERIFFLMEF